MSSSTAPIPRLGNRVPGSGIRLKYLAFAAVAAMLAYVLYHNERFLLDSAHPAWGHYRPFQWWLLPHGLAGACVMFLAPLQFSNRLRRRYVKVHRTIGGIYVFAVMVLAPVGIVIQYYDESQGAARSFTIETLVQALILMTTTGFALWNILQGNIARHRQWIFRSYAAALTFLEIRVVLGVFGLDNPIDWHVLETVVWFFTASGVLVGDIANEVYDRVTARARTR